MWNQSFTVLPAAHELVVCSWRLGHKPLHLISGLLREVYLLCLLGMWDRAKVSNARWPLRKQQIAHPWGKRVMGSAPCWPQGWCWKAAGLAHPKLELYLLGQPDTGAPGQCDTHARQLIIPNSCRHKHLMQNFGRSTCWDPASSSPKDIVSSAMR